MNSTEEDHMSQPTSPTTGLVNKMVNETINSEDHPTNQTLFAVHDASSSQEEEKEQVSPDASIDPSSSINLNQFLASIDLKKLEEMSPHTKVFLNKESTLESGLLFIDGISDPTRFSSKKFLERTYHIPSTLNFNEKIVEKNLKHKTVTVGENLAMMSSKRTFSFLEYVLSPELTLSCDEITFDWNGFACQLMTIFPFSDESPIEKIRIFSDYNQFYLKGSLNLTKKLDEAVLDDFMIVGGHMMVFLKNDKLQDTLSSQSIN